MYAVIKTGGKQYKVAAGDVVKVEKLVGEEGSEVVFNEVLALGDKIGTPLVSGASVKATILKQAKDQKVIVFKKKRRQNYRRKNGHRQNITLVKISDFAGAKPAKAKAAKAEASAE
ncbi:MAG: 50S ribosomal protein L21 [Alphaproteobacteria bacterium]|nr:50S ribosomal protein L21 [Alphaproteobacteria bacterium]